MPALNIPPPRPYVQYTNPDGSLTIQGYDLLYGMYLRIGGSLADLNAATLADKTWDAPNPIGTTTANVGQFTTLGSLQLAATVSANFTTSGIVTIKPAVTGAMDNVTIGAVTPRPGSFTTLSSTGAINFSPSNADVGFGPTGTGRVFITPASQGYMDNMEVGRFVRAPVTGTTVVSVGGFGCNGMPAASPYPSGGALSAYAAGANGLSTAADMQALKLMVVTIRQALINVGIMT